MSTTQAPKFSQEDIESLMEGETESDCETCETKNVSLMEVGRKRHDIYGCVDCEFITQNPRIWGDYNCDEFKK